MKNKKIASLLVAGALTVGVVGGTLAWLTASDKVVNEFNTGVAGDHQQKVGVEIYEKFDKDAANELLPGTTVDKNVQVQNTATFDQFIRVKVDLKNTLSDKVKMNFGQNLTASEEAKDLTNSKWVKSGEYYYYLGKVAPEKFTNSLLESVTFDKSATMDQMNKAFNIDVTAESVQASNGAYNDAFKEASSSVKSKLANLEKGAAESGAPLVIGSGATK